jgi:hypothetical protein
MCRAKAEAEEPELTALSRRITSPIFKTIKAMIQQAIAWEMKLL